MTGFRLRTTTPRLHDSDDQRGRENGSASLPHSRPAADAAQHTGYSADLCGRPAQFHKLTVPHRGLSRSPIDCVPVKVHEVAPEIAAQARADHRRVISAITLLPGDGIGPKVIEAARLVLNGRGTMVASLRIS